jgi:hypothetical protein
MWATEKFDYIFFPIVMFIWVLYTFFEENDKEYRRRNGDYYEIKDDWWLYDTKANHRNNNYRLYDDDYTYGKYNVYKSYKVDNTEQYKNVVKRCKRNFKITINKSNNDE